MPLPVTFATLAQGNQPLSLLDTQFATLGLFTVIPCGSTGQNAVVLTPTAVSPTFTQYFPWAPVFTWRQNQTSTGPVTIQIAGLATVNAYGSNGGVALGSGDLVAGNIYQCAYDPNLNTGAGGFVVNAQTPITSAGGWVPTILGSTVAGTPVYVNQVGSYEQIGSQVTARFLVSVSALTGCTGNALIGGLPVPNNAVTLGMCSIT